MRRIIDNIAEVKRISPPHDGFHYFFGYYDNMAFSGDNLAHLCHRIPFCDRMPGALDPIELGLIDLMTRQYIKVDATHAWNFQQGAMLQWFPQGSANQIVYNAYNGANHVTVIKNVVNGQTRCLDRPLACVAANGTYGLSINFRRVHDFRPVCGYCQGTDPGYDDQAPKQDGVFLMDMSTGESSLIISYRDLADLFPLPHDQKMQKIVINHISFNTASDRFVFLLRYFNRPGDRWQTAIGTSDLTGHVYPLRGYTYASHYQWRDDRHLMVYADAGDGLALYDLEDLTQNYTLYDPIFFTQDIHCNFSPDRKYIVGDGYPDADGFREIFLYNMASSRGKSLGKFYSDPNLTGDYRCDLHTRWSPCGNLISFDSSHEDSRGIYMMDLHDVL